MNSGLIHNPWVHTADQLPSTYASLKDAVLAAGCFDEVEADVHVKLAMDFPAGANYGPFVRAYMPMGREWEQIALAVLGEMRKADIRSDGTLCVDGEIYQTRDGGGGASIEPRKLPPLDLAALRKSFPVLLRPASVANRIMAILINATESMSVLSLSGGKGSSGGARRSARAALESLEREGLAVRNGARWVRGPGTFRP